MQLYLPSHISHFLHEHLNTYAESKHLLLHPTQYTDLTETLKLQVSKPVPCAITHKGVTCETLWIGTPLLQRLTPFTNALPPPIKLLSKREREEGKKEEKQTNEVLISWLFYPLLLTSRAWETGEKRENKISNSSATWGMGGVFKKTFCNNQCNSKIISCHRLLYFQISQLLHFTTKNICIVEAQGYWAWSSKISLLKSQLSNRVTKASPEKRQIPASPSHRSQCFPRPCSKGGEAAISLLWT